ncbi:MAG: alkaline phosphatase family protein, partial [Clostridia bacterium]|nr:alkaline phosphatase family protein [Clostridia bacterium]
MSQSRVIVFSCDAMVYEDVELLLQLPNTKRLMQNGSMVKRVKTIYPSVTHAVHAT